MIHKPPQYASKYAEPFQDSSVVAAYGYRPPYPKAVFTILADLLPESPRRVLDVGCGTGNIARELAAYVGHVDAVDFSWPMIAAGKQLPNGNHPHLRWLYGRIEEVKLDPPYGLVTAGESLHWLDWNLVLPRFRELLLPGAFLAVVNHETVPDPWSTLHAIIPDYRTDGGYVENKKPTICLVGFNSTRLLPQCANSLTCPTEAVEWVPSVPCMLCSL